MGNTAKPGITPVQINDSFQLPPGTKWEVFEASDDDRAQVDGYNLLARARGPAFLVEHSSLNHPYPTAAHCGPTPSLKMLKS